MLAEAPRLLVGPAFWMGCWAGAEVEGKERLSQVGLLFQELPLGLWLLFRKGQVIGVLLGII